MVKSDHPRHIMAQTGSNDRVFTIGDDDNTSSPLTLIQHPQIDDEGRGLELAVIMWVVLVVCNKKSLRKIQLHI